MAKKVMTSACLLGERCRYDGESRPNKEVILLSKKEELIAVCPERLGGLQTPRDPSEIVGGDGNDVLEGRARVVSKD